MSRTSPPLVLGYPSTLARMSVRVHVQMGPEMHAFLVEEANRTGLSVAELIRRSVDAVYRPTRRKRVRGIVATLAVGKRPDAAIVGRRPGIRFVD